MKAKEEVAKAYFDCVVSIATELGYSSLAEEFEFLWRVKEYRKAYLLVESNDGLRTKVASTDSVDEDFYWLFIA